MQVKRGDVWFANLGDGDGSEQRGTRPVLIVQNDVGNEFSPTVIVASLTDAAKRYMPTHSNVNRIGMMKKPSTVLLEQIRTIDKSKLIERIATLPDHLMVDVDEKIKVSLGLVPVRKPAKQHG